MLLLLEGQPVNFSAPKTHYAQQTVFKKDTPTFLTSKSEIISVKGGVLNERETYVMWYEGMCILCTLKYQNQNK